MENEVLKGIQDNLEKSKQFTEVLRSYNLNPTGYVELSTKEPMEIIEGINVQDITSPLQYLKGITVLSVEASKEVEFGEHIHDKQSQVIYVMRGKVYDMQANIMFVEGQCFLVPKSNRHTIKYMPGCEAIVVYMPKLHTSK